MTSPATPRASAAARYMTMVGATPRQRQRRRVSAEDPIDIPNEPVTGEELVAALRPYASTSSESRSSGTPHIIELPEVVIEGERPDPDSLVTSLRAAAVDQARDARRIRDMDATPNDAQRVFVDREHATPLTAVVRGLGQSASANHMDEILGMRDTLGDIGEAIAGDRDWSTVPDRYASHRDRWRMHYRNTEEDQPEFYSFGQVLPIAFSQPGGLTGRAAGWVGQAPTALGRIARSGIVGAGFGAANAEGSAETPLNSGDTALQALGGAGLGGMFGLGLSALGEGYGWLRRRMGAGRQFAEAQRELAERSRRIAESDDLPNVGARAMDDIDLQDALSADDAIDAIPPSSAGRGADPEAESSTIRSLITEPLRADPNVQRLRSSGLVTIPQARAVSRQPGGIEQFADDLDALGITQRGEISPTDVNVQRAERIRDRAVAQRQRVLRQAVERGATVQPEAISERLRARAGELWNTTNPVDHRQAERLWQLADDLEREYGAIDDAVAVGERALARDDAGRIRAHAMSIDAEDTPVDYIIPYGDETVVQPSVARRGAATPAQPTPQPQPQRGGMSLDDLEREIQSYTQQARYDRNRGEAVLSPEILTARDIRRAFVDARLRALTEVDPDLARQFQNAQRAYQVGVTVVPRDAAARAQLGEMNRTLSMTDMQAGIAGAAAGGPIGGIALATANRGYRRIEPALFATINEGAILRERAAQGALSPAAARMMELAVQRPEAIGRAAQVLVNAEARGPSAVEAAFRVLLRQDPAVRAAAQELEEGPVDPLQGLDDTSGEQIDPLEGLE